MCKGREALLRLPYSNPYDKGARQGIHRRITWRSGGFQRTLHTEPAATGYRWSETLFRTHQIYVRFFSPLHSCFCLRKTLLWIVKVCREGIRNFIGAVAFQLFLLSLLCADEGRPIFDCHLESRRGSTTNRLRDRS